MSKLRVFGLFLALGLAVAPATGQLVINEIYYDAPGTDVGCFTEIKGDPGTPLDGYALFGVNGNGGAVYASVPLDGYVIPADGYFVVGQDTSVGEADLINPDVNWQNGPDQVQLVFISAGEADTLIIDSICYGGSADLVCEGDPGPDVPSGSSIARCPDGQDTDNNAADCFEDPTPTPGMANDADCQPPTPTDYTVCEVTEVDADGFPIHYGELVHLVDPVITLNDNLTYADNRFEVYVTDGQCCVELFDFNIVDPMPMGTVLDVVGTVDFYNGKVELTNLTLTVLGTDQVPDPYEITTGELASNGEAYEGCLVKICGLIIVDGTWPAEGQNANLTVDDGSGPVTMRIDKDTNIDGSPAPEMPFTAIGVAGQYDTSSPYWDGYQFLPRSLDDILSGVDCPPPTAVEETSWGRIKSLFR
jgi:hypothetical protein